MITLDLPSRCDDPKMQKRDVHCVRRRFPRVWKYQQPRLGGAGVSYMIVRASYKNVGLAGGDVPSHTVSDRLQTGPPLRLLRRLAALELGHSVHGSGINMPSVCISMKHSYKIILSPLRENGISCVLRHNGSKHGLALNITVNPCQAGILYHLHLPALCIQCKKGTSNCVNFICGQGNKER